MFPPTFFPNRMFAARFFPVGTGVPVVPSAGPTMGSGHGLALPAGFTLAPSTE